VWLILFQGKGMSGRALVTGAAGFVGSTLSELLEQRGWEVVRGVLPGQEGGLPCDITDPKPCCRSLRRGRAT
jgi:nucleoside-diphosphate-sugar epimerase